MPHGKDVPVSPQGDAASRVAALPPRCRDVLNGIMAGYSSKMIAYQLGISPRTVEIHRAHLKLRLGARNMADAIRVACEARNLCESLPAGREPQRLGDEPLAAPGASLPEQGVLFPIPQSARSRAR